MTVGWAMTVTLSKEIGQLSIDVDALSRRAESVASLTSYKGSELQTERLLSIARELRDLSAEIEALR